MRGIIVTADDFGLHERVNEAVARAHREGVLTCASLMVGAPAAHDAVKTARALPDLRVGLHLVLTDGAASLPHWSIPELVDARGNFEGSMFANGVRFHLLRSVRRQLANEIFAQFNAFAATGLALDHVNVHKHFHLHPTVLELILEIGPQFGMRAMRLPREMHGSLLLKPWVALMKKRLDDAGVDHNDWVAGIASTGRMDEAAWLALLAKAPEGLLEIYSHPATDGAPLTPAMRDYRHADELAALCSPRVARAIEATGAMHGGFADVFGHAPTREPVT
ncbi:hopanoid biosynthesis-associated protein HpnK [Caballeronia sp. J97]|uniref:hopanoid biosynthesis-associated protein HpnK n=1 Tax=Caballeronia sp. J97 TaxID=2805429 RepID=UPI002AB0D251|nr:hopanoid biosynthesis-associated protein HpnK [Caballeronia sp. J97]